MFKKSVRLAAATALLACTLAWPAGAALADEVDFAVDEPVVAAAPTDDISDDALAGGDDCGSSWGEDQGQEASGDVGSSDDEAAGEEGAPAEGDQEGDDADGDGSEEGDGSDPADDGPATDPAGNDPAGPDEPADPAGYDPAVPGNPADSSDDDPSIDTPDPTGPDDADKAEGDQADVDKADADGEKKEDADKKDEDKKDAEEVVLAAEAPFADTPADSWYVQGGFIDYVVSEGLMTGYSGTENFGPEDGITRGQLVTILYRYATGDSGAGGQVSHFSDVPRGMYFTAPVEWAYQEGITTGYAGTGTFGPYDLVTREDLAVMLLRFARLCGESGSGGSISSFPDAGAVSWYATKAMGWCVASGIISGDVGSGQALLNPQDGATRAQAAKMLTVLTRDVLGGGGYQGAWWDFDSLDVPAYAPAGVITAEALTGGAEGLTYTFGWYTDYDGWSSSAQSSDTFAFYLGSADTFTIWCMATDSNGVSKIRQAKVKTWSASPLSVNSDGGVAPKSTVTLATTIENDPGNLSYSWSWELEGSDETSSGEGRTAELGDAAGVYAFTVDVSDALGNTTTLKARVYAASETKEQVVERLYSYLSPFFGSDDGTLFENAVLDAGGHLCYDKTGFWCGAYLWWAFNEAGYGYAFCNGQPLVEPRLMVAYYQSVGLYDTDVRNAKPGDLVFIRHSDVDPSYAAGHVALCTGVTSSGLRLVDGNTPTCSEYHLAYYYYGYVGVAHITY